MSESYSVRAKLSATDSGFTSTMNKALSSIKNLGGQVKSGFAFGVLTGAGQAAFHSITNSVTGLIGEIDSSNASWKTFTKNMQMVGKSEKEIASVKTELQDFAQTTVYSSSDMATTFAQLEAVGVKNTTSLVKGFGGLAAAAENPQQAMKTLSTQATQMAAKPTVAWADFKLMLEQSPAGIAAIAKEMGMTTAELVSNVQDGEIATDKFFDAIAKVGTNDAFSDLATEAKTVGQAMDGLKETIGNKLTPAFEVLNQKGISIINKLSDKLSGINADALAKKVSDMVAKCEKYFTALSEAFSGVGTEIWNAVKEIGSALLGLDGKFGSTDSVEGFKSTMKAVADVIKSVASFCKEHASAIATLIKWLPAIVIGIKGLKLASAVAPGISAVAKGISGLASKGIGGIASKLFGISKAQKEVGSASVTSGAQMLTSAKSFALMGIAVLAIAAGFALLAYSAIALSNAGGGAIAIMAGLLITLVALSIGLMVFLKSIAPMGAQLMPVATAFLAMGAAVLLVSAGFALLAVASIALADAGGAAVVVMVAMVATIALLAIGAAVLAPALAAGAVGLLAFGAGLALCGVGALLTATALLVLSKALPALSENGLSGSLAIIALSGAMVVFAAGALVAGAAAIVLAAGLAATAIGLAALSIAIALLAAGITLLSLSAILASSAISMLASTFPALAAYGLTCAAALIALGSALLVFGAGATVAGAAALLLGAGLLVVSAAIIVTSAGMLVLSAALIGVNSQMKSIAKNAKEAESSLSSMKSSINAVESGLSAVGSMVKSAMKKLISAFDNTASKVKTSGKKLGEAFKTGLQGGLQQSPAVAKKAIATVITALNSGATSAFAAGAFISKGFALGMLSCLGTIQNAAAKMAAAADKAVRAKAKIHSPSKVSTEAGEYFAEGWVNGILSKANEAWDAAEKLVTLPALSGPSLAMAYSGELSSDYEYARNAEYTIEVPLTVDGKEFARATATYTQEELNRKQTRNDRKHGKL